MSAKTIICFLLVIGFSVFNSCKGDSEDKDEYRCVPCEDNASTVTNVITSTASLPVTPKWAYMIQNDVTTKISGTDFNIFVMDYTKDGTDDVEQRYSSAEMNLIKNGSTRLAIAYLSIGEAENYRYYFDSDWTDDGEDDQPDRDAPCWLNRTNPDWEGNYKVQYWSEAWQQIILNYVDKIIDYGFDGVYLDIIDGFEYWSDEENGEGHSISEAEAAARMINFVKRIAVHSRAQGSGFLIIPQNGERILDYDISGDYVDVIDGIGIEDLYYNERTVIDTATTNERRNYLNGIGKPVIVVDYVYAGSKDAIVNDFITKVTAVAYFPYAARTDRELDDIVKFTGQGE